MNGSTDANQDDPATDPAWTEACQITRMIVNELHHAMLLNAIWWRCSTQVDILDEMRGTTKGVAFDAIRDAVHMSLVQCIMRMHDRDSRTASLDRMLRCLRSPELLATLERKSWARRFDISKAVASATAIYESDDYKVMRQGLRALRDQMIAHLDMKPVEHGVQYGHEAALLNLAAQVFQYLQLALTGTSDDFESASEQYAQCADEFWTHAARPEIRGGK